MQKYHKKLLTVAFHCFYISWFLNLFITNFVNGKSDITLFPLAGSLLIMSTTWLLISNYLKKRNLFFSWTYKKYLIIFNLIKIVNSVVFLVVFLMPNQSSQIIPNFVSFSIDFLFLPEFITLAFLFTAIEIDAGMILFIIKFSNREGLETKKLEHIKMQR